MSTQRVVLIGAARSGTKILRDALAEATGVGKVPYDIGYVWRIGNEDRPDDVLLPEEVSESARRFIRCFVDRYAAGERPTVIEKTVGNSMRVPAVAAVFPNAKYIHLLRDGVDVIESTRRQWLAPADFLYLSRKVRHFPVRLLPRYGLKYLHSLTARRTGAGRIGSWGPRYPGIEDDLRQGDLVTICAKQWRYGVELASADFERLSLSVLEVRYEELVRDSVRQLIRIAQFLGTPTLSEHLYSASRAITAGRQGVGRGRLTDSELTTIETEVGDLLTKLGYDRPRPESNSFEPKTGIE